MTGNAYMFADAEYLYARLRDFIKRGFGCTAYQVSGAAFTFSENLSLKDPYRTITKLQVATGSLLSYRGTGVFLSELQRGLSKAMVKK